MNELRAFKIGRYVIPLWLIVVILISSGVFGYYVWKTLTIPLEVKEPIEVLDYPTELSLYPGEMKEFNITILNSASVNYSVILGFQLTNITYQADYVTFSDEIYTVLPGEQNLTCSVSVDSDAPPVTESLTIDLHRGVYPHNLVGYWKFDEGVGKVAFDRTKSENHGILINDPKWVDGKYGQAIEFDGIDDFVSIPDSPSLRVQNFTLAAWIYMTKRPYQHGTPASAIINKIHNLGGGPMKGYKLQFEAPTATNDRLVLTLGDGTAQRFLIEYNSINDLTLNQWHHVVGTYDGSTAKIYIDGELKSISHPGTHVVAHDYAPLIIGTEYTYELNTLFNGIIDNAMVYSRALSEQEIEGILASPIP